MNNKKRHTYNNIMRVSVHSLNILITMVGFVSSFTSRSLSKVGVNTSSRRILSLSSSSRRHLDQRLCYSSLANNNIQHEHIICKRTATAAATTTQLKLFFSTNGDENNEVENNSSSSSNKDTDEKQQQQPLLLLDPKAPLRPLLSTSTHENHLSHYTLPPTTIGTDDYRPTLKKGTRIVSFGDVHGDISALRTFLITADVLDPESTNEEPIWCGGETLCVQTGDVLDRGDDELACFRLLATLSRQATKAGGALLLLYGNHESLNAAGLFQYANPGGNYEFESTIGRRIDYNYGSNRWRLQFAGNEPSRWASFEPGGLLAENMLGNMLVACVLGRTVFVHAGLMESHLKDGNVLEEVEDGDGEVRLRKRYGGISRLNEQAREWILKGEFII